MSHSLHVSISVSFFLRSLSLLITDRDKSSGLLAFSSSGERKKKGGGGRRRKKSAAVSLFYSSCSTGLEGQKLPLTGRIAAISTQPTCHHHVSSPYCHILPPPPPTTITTPLPHGLIRITQFMGISVWCVEEEIARHWFRLSVITLITLCGRDTCSCAFGCYVYISMLYVCHGTAAIPRHFPVKCFFQCDLTTLIGRPAQGLQYRCYQ